MSETAARPSDTDLVVRRGPGGSSDGSGAGAAAVPGDDAGADVGADAPGKRGPGRPRLQPLAQQRQGVLDAALEVFARHGYHGATIEQVARRSGTPRPTVYELFGGKEDLFLAVVNAAADRVAARLSASFTESEDFGLRSFVRHNFAAVFDLFAADRDALTVLINAEQGVNDKSTAAPRDMRKRLLLEITAFTRSRWEKLGVDIGFAAELMALMFFRMAEAFAQREADDGDWDREALIDLLTEFTIGGIERLWAESTDVLVAAGRRKRAGSPRSAG
jgi:AcrR family transcriptional regulator